LLLVLAALLRLPRAILRWTEDSWSYLAYDAEMAQAFEQGRLLDGLTTFTGLHPPGWHLFHNLVEVSIGVPMVVLLSSVACSVAAVWIAGRMGMLVGLLVATSPIQVAYAAELNNYPAMTLCIAWIWLARERTEERGGGWALAIATVVGAWIHLLAGLIGLIAATTLGRRQFQRVSGVLVLGLLPLVPSMLELLGQSSSFSQPPYKVDLVLPDFGARFGWLSLVLWIPALLGAKRRPQIAWGLGLSVGLILGLQLAGMAAPHQFPYFLALTVPFALLVQAGAKAPWLRLLVLGVILVHGISLMRINGVQLGDLDTDLERTRAIDVALSESQAGDAIYLLRKRNRPDDDKRGISGQLWRISPWKQLQRTRPYDFPYVDHRHGQPRKMGKRTIYVNDHARAPLIDAIRAHRRLYLIVSEHRGDPRYNANLVEMLRGTPLLQVSAPERHGQDHLYRLSAENSVGNDSQP